MNSEWTSNFEVLFHDQKTKVLHWCNRVTSIPTGKHVEPTWGSWVVSSLACKLLRKVRSCGKRVWVLFALFGGIAGGTHSLPWAREVLHSYTSRSSSHLWAGRFWRVLLLPACQESLGCKVRGGGGWGVCEWVQLNGVIQRLMPHAFFSWLSANLSMMSEVH